MGGGLVDALLERGALSVEVTDADVDTRHEAPVQRTRRSGRDCLAHATLRYYSTSASMLRRCWLWPVTPSKRLFPASCASNRCRSKTGCKRLTRIQADPDLSRPGSCRPRVGPGTGTLVLRLDPGSLLEQVLILRRGSVCGGSMNTLASGAVGPGLRVRQRYPGIAAKLRGRSGCRNRHGSRGLGGERAQRSPRTA